MSTVKTNLNQALTELLVLAGAPKDMHTQIASALMGHSNSCVLERNGDFWIVLESLNLKTRQLPPHPLLISLQGGSENFEVTEVRDTENNLASEKVALMIASTNTRGRYKIEMPFNDASIRVSGAIPPSSRRPWFVPLGGAVRTPRPGVVECNFANARLRQIVWQVAHDATIYLYQRTVSGWYYFIIRQPAWPTLKVYDEKIGNNFGTALQKLLLL